MFSGVPIQLYDDMLKDRGVYTQLPLDVSFLEMFIKDEHLCDVPENISYFNNGSRGGVISSVDHPSFAKSRDFLENQGYIETRRHYSNGDRVLKPFYLNGLLFDEGDRFPCAAAMKSHIKYAHIYNPRELFIQNVSLSDFIEGDYNDPTLNSMLISIVDPEMYHPEYKVTNKFREVHTFKFLDAYSQEYGRSDGRYREDWLIQDEQAQDIVNALKRAEEQNMNVVVHCVAGLYRSGAVVDFALEHFRFNDTHRVRRRNDMVYDKLKEVKGDHNEKPI